MYSYWMKIMSISKSKWQNSPISKLKPMIDKDNFNSTLIYNAKSTFIAQQCTAYYKAMRTWGTNMALNSNMIQGAQNHRQLTTKRPRRTLWRSWGWWRGAGLIWPRAGWPLSDWPTQTWCPSWRKCWGGFTLNCLKLKTKLSSILTTVF